MRVNIVHQAIKGNLERQSSKVKARTFEALSLTLGSGVRNAHTLTVFGVSALAQLAAEMEAVDQRIN